MFPTEKRPPAYRLPSHTPSSRPAAVLACLSAAWLLAWAVPIGAQTPFRVFMIASKAADHLATSSAAKTAVEKLGADNGFTVDYTLDTARISDAVLDGYQVFFQEHLAPFEVSTPRRAALEKFVASGRGWVGVHAAGLCQPEWGNNKPYWQWYQDFFGGVAYVNHPALQNGTVVFEDRTHPATKNMPASFQIKDEWYEWNGNPRPNVHVLGKADESTYTQVKPQGDHPIIWSNQKHPKMIYIGIGHDVSVWSHPEYLKLVRDAVLWAKPAASRLDYRADEKGYLGTPVSAPMRSWDPLGRALPVLRAERFRIGGPHGGAFNRPVVSMQ